MKKIILYSSILLLLVFCVSAVTDDNALEKSSADDKVPALDKHSFVELVENTDRCLDCHTIYRITKASPQALKKLGLYFKDDKNQDAAPVYELTVLTEEEYVEEEPVFEQCNKTLNFTDNETGIVSAQTFESQCLKEKKEINKKREVYSPTDFDSLKASYDSAEKGKSFYIKISGRLSEGEAFDNILSLDDYDYTEYAWWNATFEERKLINCTNVETGVPVTVDGADGFDIDGRAQIVETECASELYVYYNNASDYIMVHNGSQVPFKVISGDGRSYLPEQVWMNITNLPAGISIGKAFDIYHPIVISTSTDQNQFAYSLAAEENYVYNVAVWAAASYPVGGYVSIITEYSNGNTYADYEQFLRGGHGVAWLYWTNPHPEQKVSKINYYARSGTSGAQIELYTFNLLAFNFNSYLTNISDGQAGFGNIEDYELYDNATSANSTEALDAMMLGISLSSVGDSAKVMQNRRVYLKRADGSEYNGLFRFFVASGSKRWAFNYNANPNATFPAMPNIEPVLYVWQKKDMSYSSIKYDVRDFIDNSFN